MGNDENKIRKASAKPESASSRDWKPSFNPWLIAVSVMLATFMEVLDTSVANVALPHIAGNLSASTDESTWVLTSYLVSNAIILPAANWLGRYFGRKRFLIVCITIFTLSSALCGAATSLGMLIVARIAQGAGGGALQPIVPTTILGAGSFTSTFLSGCSPFSCPTCLSRIRHTSKIRDRAASITSDSD